MVVEIYRISGKYFFLLLVTIKTINTVNKTKIVTCKNKLFSTAEDLHCLSGTDSFLPI